MIPIALLSNFYYKQGGNTLWLCLGVVIYSIYLIIDTMMIVGGKSMNGMQCNSDDYIIGAMMLYMDIVILFVYILRILGKKD
jgi:FtsH-binding integral membrane protein